MRRLKLRTADRIAGLVLAALFVACGSTTVVALSRSSPAPVPAIKLSANPGRDSHPDDLTLRFVGDTFLGDAAQEQLTASGYDWPFERLLLDPVDLTIANAEGPITTLPPNFGKKYAYSSDPRAATALKNHGIDILSLANNHTMDAGPAGLVETRAYTMQVGITTFGAGTNSTDARRPLIIDDGHGQKIGIVAFTENFGSSSAATTSQAGLVYFREDRIKEGIAAAHAAGATIVVALAHWGNNYESVNSEQEYWAVQLAAAGYDLVVGSGSHMAQRIDVVSGVPVVYGLGNYVFTTEGRYRKFGVPGQSVALTVTVSGSGISHIEITCLETDNAVTNFRTTMCDPQVASAVLPMLHPGMDFEGATGTMTRPWPVWEPSTLGRHTWE